MQKINLGVAAIIAFGGFLETNALKVNSKLAEEDHPKPEIIELAQEELDHPKPEIIELAQSSDNEENSSKPPEMMFAQAGQYKSTAWNQGLSITFDNTSDYAVTLYWHDYSGNEVTYGTIGAHQTMAMYTYVTHPWSVTGDGDYTVDGDDVWVPQSADANRKISIVRKDPDFTCDPYVNFTLHGPSYNQISLTDGCGQHNGVCDMNPVYASDGQTCDREEAIAYCEAECQNRDSNGTGCEGFFFQKHNNGHEICGFYQSGMDQGSQVWHGHAQGAICQRRGYTLVTSGDCIGDQLVESVQECQDAIADVFGVQDAVVHTWNTSAYAKGCFKHNYGHPGSTQAANAPTYWIFNHNGGPGTSGHCTGEPGYAACICRED